MVEMPMAIDKMKHETPKYWFFTYPKAKIKIDINKNETQTKSEGFP
jgi:hypothetical protein